ncbi:glycoside hydrolase family 38 C-terminal domain-containing protein [Deinococcus metallilatus]|uniref:Alpha-mannosidase n=1 Tax=Deinococcus metallilatus TaxID=1211322 RepID=A0ABR6MWQ5_9DEIO|nr:glycoside hydrolase family 38 C-terminal domain-containing protein [Deinococcus metallilatus]MBB5295676.1 alpha-mannosidase [Deinococcus metallilatus]GMA14205.1 hypothetical protein GCM10025871_05360 [Deinococcus metallilatus]
MTSAPLHVHVVCTTHWDREWYLSAERFRFRLVRTMDAVLALLEAHPNYRFTLDGQAIVLEDYLEIRPEREAELRRHLASGRLRAGPWYVQPDEFLVSDEALRRNLDLGMALVRRLGGQPVMAGYLPDAFGHLANLPAVLRSRGIGAAIFTRGPDPQVAALGDLFCWRAPGGEAVVAHRQPIGYGLTLSEDPQAARAQLRAALGALQAEARGHELLLQLGSDHSRPQPFVPELIGAVGAPFTFSDHDAYLAAVRAEHLTLPVYQGELRSGARHPLLSGTLSARLYLKRRNFALDDRLRFTAEPLLARAAPSGGAPPEAYLRRAWTLLVRNHPHDSICGCSVDEVHDEMEVRFQQAEGIAEELERDALARLAGSPDAGRLLVLNPHAGAFLDTELLLARAEVAGGAARVGGQPAQLGAVRSALVSTLAGPASELPQWLEQLEDRHPVRWLSWTVAGTHLRAEVDEGPRAPDCPAPDALLAEAIAHGVRTVELRVYQTRARLTTALAGTAPAQALDLAAASDLPAEGAGTARLLGAHLVVEVDHQDGTLRVTERKTGRVWPGLHALHDVGDRGDTYTFSATPEAPIRARLLSAEVAERGPVRQSLDLVYELRLPEGLTPERDARSPATVSLLVRTRVALWAAARHVEFSTSFTNTARDHRLRVHFPGPGRGSLADSAGVTVSRPDLRPSADTVNWAEQPADAHPLTHWAAKQDPAGSWGVAARGLSEYGHADGLSLTLVRAVGWLSRDDLPERPSQAGPPYSVPGAQCLRALTAEYAWFPAFAAAEQLNAAALAYAHPPRAWLVPARPSPPPPP